MGKDIMCIHLQDPHLDYNIPESIGYEDLLRTAVKLGQMGSLETTFLTDAFNYMFVNQDDHGKLFFYVR